MTQILGVDLFRNWRFLKTPKANLVSYLITIIFSLALGLLPMVDNFAHIGGFVMGIIIGIVFLPSSHVGKVGNRNRLIQVGIALPLMLTLFVVSYIGLYSSLPPDWCAFCNSFSCIEIADFKCDE